MLLVTDLMVYILVKKYLEYTFWCQTSVRHCDKHIQANTYDMPNCDKPHEVYTDERPYAHEVYTDERPYGTYLTCHKP